MLKRAAQTDKAEADEPELDIPAELALRQQRLEAIKAAKQRLEARQREADTRRGRKPEGKDADGNDGDGGGSGASDTAPQPKKRGPAFKRAFGVPEPKAQDNFTDPDSRIMKTSAGFEQCYNAQTAVDAGAQIIVAAELSNCAADSALLPTMLDAVKSNTGQVPEVLLADAGYRSEAVLAQLSGKQVEVIVALGREGKKQLEIDAHKHPHTAAMAAKLKTQPGQDKYRRRKAIVEPPNAWIKQVLGFRQFSFKGIDKVRCEFKLVCAALNLRRMAAMGV